MKNNYQFELERHFFRESFPGVLKEQSEVWAFTIQAQVQSMSIQLIRVGDRPI